MLFETIFGLMKFCGMFICLMILAFSVIFSYGGFVISPFVFVYFLIKKNYEHLKSCLFVFLISFFVMIISTQIVIWVR